MDGQLAQIATAYSVSEAHIIQSMLRSYGIEAQLFDLQTVNTDPGLMFAVGGIRIFVAEDDAATAQELVWRPETRATSWSLAGDLQPQSLAQWHRRDRSRVHGRGLASADRKAQA